MFCLYSELISCKQVGHSLRLDILNLIKDNDLNKKVNIYSIKYPLKENQQKSLKWMIEKENLGNRYLNPNIEYIPLSGSKYFLKAGDYSMLYNHNYNVDSYFKCFGQKKDSRRYYGFSHNDC